MINRKLGFTVILIAFILSSYSTYSYFSGSLKTGLSLPLSKYQPPKGNGNGSSGSEAESTEPKTEECPINGEMLTEKQKDKWLTRRPLAVMIENHKDARPQSGLTSADVIYEAVAEGGITRFMAVYYCKDASYIGPIRSARIYFIKLLQEYGDFPLYAHVGGANCDKETGSGCDNGAPADALGTIRRLGWEIYNDLNQFGVPFPYFWRDPERLPGRSTEHTVYSSTPKLWQYADQKRQLTNIDEEGNAWDKKFVKWEFADDAKSADRGKVDTISFKFWQSFADDFAVIWKYDAKTNSYKRTNGGVLHEDKNNKKTIESKNIVIIFAKETPANDGYDGGHMLYGVTGSGDGLLFQNGKASEISWDKEDEETRMTFLDKDNKQIPFVRGQIFFEILPIGNKVTY